MCSRVHLLSSFTDGNLDYTRMHELSLEREEVSGVELSDLRYIALQIVTHDCSPDDNYGMPFARKQAAIESLPGTLLVVGEGTVTGLAHRLHHSRGWRD